MSRLETVEEAAGEGDFVVMDYVGTLAGEDEPFEGGTGTDQLIELGSGRLIPGFEEGLTGASAGDDRTVDLSFPDDYQAEHLAGRDATFAVTVKEIRRKVLPELDDDVRLRRRRLRDARRAARGHRHAPEGAGRAARRGRVPRGRARRRRRAGDRRRCPNALIARARRRADGADAAQPRAPGHLARHVLPDLGQDRGGAARGGLRGGRAHARARGRARRDRRGRGPRAAPTATSSTRCRRAPSATRRRPRSCASGSRRPGASTTCWTTCASGRRWT